MSKQYIYQQTIVQWRIPIEPDGKLGNPEIVKKFTSEWGGSQGKHKKRPKTIKRLTSTNAGEVTL